MGQAIAVRMDFTAGEVRRVAKQAKDSGQARRLLAIAAVSRGRFAGRCSAAEDRWHGPSNVAGLGDPVQRARAGRSYQHSFTGRAAKLGKKHRAFLVGSWKRARSQRCTVWCAAGHAATGPSSVTQSEGWYKVTSAGHSRAHVAKNTAGCALAVNSIAALPCSLHTSRRSVRRRSRRRCEHQQAVRSSFQIARASSSQSVGAFGPGLTQLCSILILSVL